jgi:hypothetical protein
MRTAAVWRCTPNSVRSRQSGMGRRYSHLLDARSLNWHRAFSCPDPVGDPVPVKFDGVADAHMRQSALTRPVTDRFRMQPQDFGQVLDIEQAGLAFEFFGEGLWGHAAKIAGRMAQPSSLPDHWATNSRSVKLGLRRRRPSWTPPLPAVVRGLVVPRCRGTLPSRTRAPTAARTVRSSSL